MFVLVDCEILFFFNLNGAQLVINILTEIVFNCVSHLLE